MRESPTEGTTRKKRDKFRVSNDLNDYQPSGKLQVNLFVLRQCAVHQHVIACLVLKVVHIISKVE